MVDRSEEIQRLMEEVLDSRKNLDQQIQQGASSNRRIDDLRNEVTRMQQDLSSYIDANLKHNIDEKAQAIKQQASADFSSGSGITIHDSSTNKPVVTKDLNFEVYDSILNELKGQVFGQDDALYQMMVGFRRSLIALPTAIHKGSMIIIGPKGSGRHYAIESSLKALKKHQLIQSDAYVTLDCSRYSSNSQEALFFQDVFSAINANGNVIVIENFEKANPLYLRYLNEFLISGKILLNKRYIQNSKGQLIETNGGFVQQSVDSLQAKDHYLILMTSLSKGKLLDYFGSDIFTSIPDVVEFKPNSEEVIDKVKQIQVDQLVEKLDAHYHMHLQVDDAFMQWLKQQYIPANGVDSLVDALAHIEGFIVNLFLENKLHSYSKLYISCVSNKVSVYDGKNTLTYQQLSNDQAITEIETELNAIVGLDEVKGYVKALKDNLQAQQLRAKQGFKASEVNMHMVFTGNPGTGKTTIARLIARYMKAIGVLSKGQLIEVTRGDLVGQYVGHTAPQTMSVIKSALGGVLFIDEAYALFRGKDDSFGLEAIDTLVKAMEDYRDDLIVILAGYTQEMSDFLDANSGLKSRFPSIIEFKDYTGEQLYDIAVSIAKSKDYKVASDAKEKLIQYFELMQAKDASGNGNGRMARNVVEDAILKASARCLRNPGSALDELLAVDFVFDK